tara:strand:- start:648 stop:1268 length:621 start_codon:yes stop_codon:yes gene_type:complete
MNEISTYEFIKKNRNLLLDFKENNFLLTTIIFFISCILWVFLLGFGSPVALLGGFVFGKWFGTLIVILSLTIGATCLYLFANYFLKEFIREKFEKKFGKMLNNFKKNEFLYFFIYRFVGGIPFFIANILPTLFNIKIKNYFFGSLFGMVPGIFIIVSLGSGLEKIINENLEQPSFFDLIKSPEIFIPIIGFLFLFLITFIIRKKLN